MRLPYTQAPLRLIGLVLTLALLALRAPAGSLPRAAAQPIASGVYGPQEFWLIPHLTLSAADGTTSDVAPQLIAAASAAPGVTADLGGGLTYTDAPGLSGTATDAAGTPLPAIATRVGVLSDTNADAKGAQILMVIASTDFGDANSANSHIDENSRIALNLNALPVAAGMTGGTISFVLFETFPRAVDNTEPGLDDLAVFAQRWQDGHLQVLGAPDAAGVLKAASVQAPLTPPPPAAAADQARYQQSGAGASWNALGTDGQAQPLNASGTPSPTLARAAKKADGPVTPAAIQEGELRVGGFSCGNGGYFSCTLTLSGKGSYDTADLPTLGGHVHADITFSAKALVYDGQYHVPANLYAVKLDETYSGAGNAAGCTTRTIPSLPPPPHIADNHFHDEINANGFSLAGNILSEPSQTNATLQMTGFISGHWLQDLSLSDTIVGESWQCEKAPGFQVEIGAPALNNFALAPVIDLFTSPEQLITRVPIGQQEATVQLHVLILDNGTGSGSLDISVNLRENSGSTSP